MTPDLQLMTCQRCGNQWQDKPGAWGRWEPRMRTSGRALTFSAPQWKKCCSVPASSADSSIYGISDPLTLLERAMADASILLAKLEAFGRAGLVVSICYGKTPKGLGYTVDCLHDRTKATFDLPFAARDFSHCLEIVELEALSRGWLMTRVEVEMSALRSTEGKCTCLPKLDPRGCVAKSCPVATAIRAELGIGESR